MTKPVQYIYFEWWNLGFSWCPHIIYCIGELRWQSQAECSWMNKHRRRLRSLWNAAIQPVERHVESSVTTICPLIRNSTDTFEADSHVARLTSRYTSSRRKSEDKTKRIEAVRVGVMTPALSSCNSLWWTVMENTGGRWQRLCLWVKHSFHKSLPWKHDRSNTGLNAFSSFPIFPFQHIRLVSALSRLCNGKLLQKHFSVSRGQEVITDVTLKVTSGK